MGRLIDQMIDHDLLVRQTSARERRAHELFVTAKGAELAAKIRPIVTKQSNDFFSFIVEEEQAQLMDILRRAYRKMVGMK